MRYALPLIALLLAGCSMLSGDVRDEQGDPVMQPDGTTLTGGELAADHLDANAGKLSGTIGNAVTLGTGNPILGTAVAGIATLLAGAGAAGLRKKYGNAPPPAQPS